jgi:peptidoglycan L-alanyl-D-glutamate endopeptidase CwlK
MASRNIKDCNIKLREAWAKACIDWDDKYPELPKPFLTCTHRSIEEQAKLYAMGRTVAGKIVTNAKPGQSKHNLMPSKAFDVAFKNENGTVNWSSDLFAKFALIIETYGVNWGGHFKSFKDFPHYEI